MKATYLVPTDICQLPGTYLHPSSVCPKVSADYFRRCPNSIYSYLLLPKSGCQLPTSAPTVAASYLPQPQQWLPAPECPGLVGLVTADSGQSAAAVPTSAPTVTASYLPQPQQWLPAPERPGLVGQAPADSGQSAAAVTGVPTSAPTVAASS